MDELFIEDKRYISSKQAAKLTGYAKDYIGQLCREGRVPARLVGRSWYVLESALQDHRFGTQEKKEEKETQSDLPVIMPVTQPTEKFPAPRYEAIPSAHVLPALNRLLAEEKEIVPIEKTVEKTEDKKEETVNTSPIFPNISNTPTTPNSIHESWQGWFATPPQGMQASLKEEAHREEMVDAVVMGNHDRNESIGGPIADREPISDSETNIPIHIKKEFPEPYELSLPMRHDDAERSVLHPTEPGRMRTSVWTRIVIQIIVALLAAGAVFIAALGSGYLDKYIISHVRVYQIAGMEVYYR